MQIFEFNTFVNLNFSMHLATCWEDLGCRVDNDGNPTHDANRNTVALHYISRPTVDDADLIIDAYFGGRTADLNKGEIAHFLHWLRRELDLEEDDRLVVLGKLKDIIEEKEGE